MLKPEQCWVTCGDLPPSLRQRMSDLFNHLNNEIDYVYKARVRRVGGGTAMYLGWNRRFLVRLKRFSLEGLHQSITALEDWITSELSSSCLLKEGRKTRTLLRRSQRLVRALWKSSMNPIIFGKKPILKKQKPCKASGF